jgi:thioredoxin-like negative regulator of GroEL
VDGGRVTVVVLYTRPGCHLCDEARDAILALRESSGEFELREIDIDGDDELHARFLERIPVVQVDGEIVAELEVEAAALRVALTERGIGTVRSMTNDAGQRQQ